jgi:hypothetical protein
MATCLDADGSVRFHKSHAMCSISIVCKFVVEDEVFVKKEKINIEDEFVFAKKEKTNIEDEFVFEEEENHFVTKEKIKAVVNSNRLGVSDFPKP